MTFELNRLVKNDILEKYISAARESAENMRMEIEALKESKYFYNPNSTVLYFRISGEQPEGRTRADIISEFEKGLNSKL